MNLGDVVRLKSGGPSMTVRSIKDKQVECEWFKDEEVKIRTFAEHSLEPATKLQSQGT